MNVFPALVRVVLTKRGKVALAANNEYRCKYVLTQTDGATYRCDRLNKHDGNHMAATGDSTVVWVDSNA